MSRRMEGPAIDSAPAPAAAGGGRLADAVYLLPLRWLTPDDGELTDYLTDLSGWVRVVVIDSSPAPVFDAHRRAWRDLPLRHVAGERRAPDARDPSPARNGKASNVNRGLQATSEPLVIIADDDVRYTRASLAAVVGLLRGADLVRPQNAFDSLNWHTAWDTARSLINRAFGADYPGTLAVRRAAIAHGYAEDVLFENLELMRTVRAAGGREVHPLDVIVTRRAPTVAHFWSQRVRQAYDSQAQPGRLIAELALAPALVAVSRHPRVLAGVALGAVIVAEVGRRRAGGAAHFPALALAFAPVWTVERALCAWLALGHRARGGIPYSGARLRRAAHSLRRLRGRAPDSAPSAHPRAASAVMRVCPGGPILVRGDFQLIDPDGRALSNGRPTVALCRCGGSATKPFCDGTHKVNGFGSPDSRRHDGRR